MSVREALAKRRTIYGLSKELPVGIDEVRQLIEETVELVPDAFNMKSARVLVALGDKQDQLWDAIYEAFGGRVARDKIDGFKAAAGTVLYFTDESVVEKMQGMFEPYAANFPIWASQANGMLQISIWTALRELNIGANLQHYNPVIDETVRKLFDLPETYHLLAQMPFGGILAEPEAREKEDISQRVIFAD